MAKGTASNTRGKRNVGEIANVAHAPERDRFSGAEVRSARSGKEEKEEPGRARGSRHRRGKCRIRITPWRM
jgi:hypothetical protein